VYFKSVCDIKACKNNKPNSPCTFCFQKLLDDIRLKEQEAIKLEMVLRDLPADAETQSLEASMARLRTHIVTLMSKIEQGKTMVEVCIW
jgi:hypothetical protein